MKNARMHEALCHLFPDADPRTAWKLEQGQHTGWGVAITEWNLPSPQPTQSELDAVYAEIELEGALAAVEAKYTPKFAFLQECMVTIMLADGAEEAANVASLRQQWADLSAQKDAEVMAAIGGL